MLTRETYEEVQSVFRTRLTIAVMLHTGITILVYFVARPIFGEFDAPVTVKVMLSIGLLLTGVWFIDYCLPVPQTKNEQNSVSVGMVSGKRAQPRLLVEVLQDSESISKDMVVGTFTDSKRRLMRKRLKSFSWWSRFALLFASFSFLIWSNVKLVSSGIVRESLSVIIVLCSGALYYLFGSKYLNAEKEVFI